MITAIKMFFLRYQAMSPQKGFSLIELTIVIALIGILGAVSAYSWQQYTDNINLRTAAATLMADIADSKQNAVAEGVNYRIDFDPDNSGSYANYTIERGNADGTTYTAIQTKCVSPPGSGSGICPVNPPSFGGQRATFLPRGTVSQPGSLTISNSRNSTAKITVNITGKARVEYTMR